MAGDQASVAGMSYVLPWAALLCCKPSAPHAPLHCLPPLAHADAAPPHPVPQTHHEPVLLQIAGAPQVDPASFKGSNHFWTE